ncbi:E3 ubiquitin-protein ligase TRIM56-like [Saccostrea cucullata]|uniref:E3 ubiquitin-protein ligase TRIM56-like n=1 Tax=Saccostrea cuccullata TaxID=36930 RepID=UPI002ED6473C
MDPSCFVEKIRNDILSCSICKGILQDPKHLSCGHVFCKDCIETHFNVSHTGNSARCPMCKTLFVFCKSGSKFLKQSLILRQLIDLFSEGSGPNFLSHHDFCKSAYHCEGKGIPTHYCPRCDKRMCNGCTNAHAHFHQDHDVSPINILENSQLIDENNCKCERHKGQTLFILCTTCDSDSLLCLQCKKIHDKSHSFTTVEEMKSEIKEIRVKLLHQKEKLERQQTENRTAETMFHTSASIAMEKMTKRYEALNNTLKTRKKELETDFQNHSLEFRQTFDCTIKDTETQLIKASNVIHLIDQLFSLGSERCLLESWKIIQEHLNVISNLESKENEKMIKYGIKFRQKEGFEIGTILKTKAYEEHFGLFKENEKLNEASSNDLESTEVKEDHIAGKEHNYQTRITPSDIVYENISSPRTSAADYTENFDQATISEEMLGHRYTVLQNAHEDEDCGIRDSLTFDFDSIFETETGLSSEADYCAPRYAFHNR